MERGLASGGRSGAEAAGSSTVGPEGPRHLHEHLTDFNATSALFWEQQDLVYGDWTSGENSDGCYEHFAELDIPQVRVRIGEEA